MCDGLLKTREFEYYLMTLQFHESFLYHNLSYLCIADSSWFYTNPFRIQKGNLFLQTQSTFENSKDTNVIANQIVLYDFFHIYWHHLMKIFIKFEIAVESCFELERFSCLHFGGNQKLLDI